MVEKVGAILTIERLKALQWNKMFYMYYVEPIVFILVFSHSLSGTIMRNQVIYQACTTVFNYNESDCRQLGSKNITDYINDIETEVQPYVAHLLMVRTLIESIVPAICGVFVGSWSDNYGRRPLFVISMIGFSCTYVIAAIICEISTYYPVNPWYYILAAVPHSILGGNCVFMVAAFCFLADITDIKTRPYRMIFMEVFLFTGSISGSLLSSYVYAATNATVTFIISGIPLCAATVFIIIYLPETLHLKKDENETETNKQDLQMNSEKIEKTDGINSLTPKLEKDAKDSTIKDEKQQQEQQEPERQKITGLFSYLHIKDMLKTCFKQRPCYDRSIILLVTGTMFLSIFVIDGAMNVMYLFVREKFHWTVREYTFYETVSHLVPMFGALVGFLILRKLFGLSVVTLAILAFVSHVLSSLIRGIASESWHLYVGVASGVFNSIGGPMCHTIITNIVPTTDMGKIFSIKNVMQSLAPFVAAPLYTFIYQRSLTTFPGLFNIVSAALYLIALVFLAIVLFLKHSHKEHYAKVLK